jgi:ribosomal protein S27E
MDSIRLAPPDSVFVGVACCRCGEKDRRWDRIAGKAYCPNCQEGLAIGEGEPLIERTQPHWCAACSRPGTVAFVTFPLEAPRPVEIDVCPDHLRRLLGRCLEPHAFHQLRRQLFLLGVDVCEVFLLHDTFYDGHGRALQPAVEGD